MRFKEIYLDSGATTQIDPKVLKAMMPYLTGKYGNASSLHSMGHTAKEALEKARKTIAKSINAKTDEIYFTSGGTEANNWALKGIAFANKDKGNHIITTKIEHKCILNSCKWLESQGFKITYLNVDTEGFVNPQELEKAITDKTILVSIIHGNNEIGTIQDLEKLSEICKKHKVYFHTDACQSYTKTELNVKKQELDLVTLNSHKIHGPKGVGALYIKEGVKIIPWQHGGGQEKNMRSGTENIHGIVGFAEAVKQAIDSKHVRYMTKLRDKLIKGILQIPGVKLNGPKGEKRLCNNANFSFKGAEGEAIGGYLEQKWICSSTGSACSSSSLTPSYVLKAIGLSNEEANSSLRLTISRFTTEKEIDYVLKVLPGIIKKLRKISPIGKLIEKVF
ncbi:cysteine desulfurase NifS [Candidatus Woesearchaeota archaeon]|nr:MAG: cysteine desulfurase NifS [Candidatus Woesearchaeota archaeon ex4484_78]RLE46714.1 MAG: cysteine desulfurase NifS [Candidatus Woesearchaeota archaeon]